MQVVPFNHGFGARITDVDLNDLEPNLIQQIRDAWLTYQVVSFPDQPMDHEQLEAFSQAFGEFGDDPYVESVAGHQHILEVRREPQEEVAPFGSAWHSDWSFQASPPAATILHAKIVPPMGGETWYADGYRAFAALDEGLQAELSTLTTLHSARRPYSHEGYTAGGGERRSMKILPSDSALEVQEHPLVRTHPETGRQALWINQVYTIGIKDMAEDAASALLRKLLSHSVQEEYIYKHQWQVDMLTMWDNRSVQHHAQGGYDGHRRVMHRTTLAGDQPR